LALVIVFGIYAIIDGALALTMAARGTGESQGSIIARGIISILAGVLTLGWPGISALALLLVIASWAVVAGILEIAMAIKHRKQLRREWLLVVEGVVSIAFGVLLFIAPMAGAIALGIWVGVYALIFGVLLIAAALRVRKRETQFTPPHGAFAAA
ncbi:MAG: HdeD family acid-resistance protein, partial [Kofleriaceae bacterium]